MDTIKKLIMTINKITDKKLQYDVNIKAAKIPPISSQQIKLINMNILQMKKYYLLIKEE